MATSAGVVSKKQGSIEFNGTYVTTDGEHPGRACR